MSSEELEFIFTLEHVSGGIMESRLMELVILCISLISQEGKITKTWLGSGAKMKRKKYPRGLIQISEVSQNHSTNAIA